MGLNLRRRAFPDPQLPCGRRRQAAYTLRRLRQAAMAMVLLGIAWRILRYALGFPLWGDEAFIVASFYSRQWSDIATHMEYGQAAPPGFMWIELLSFRLLGHSVFSLRLVPLACGIGAIMLFWRFARRTLHPRAALLAVAVLAASYYPVRHANEVKPYAGDLLSATALLEMARHLRLRPQSPRRWTAMTLLGGASVWWSYPAAFVVGGIGLVLGAHVIRRRQRAAMIACTLFVVVSLASFAAMATLVAAPQSEAFGPGGRTWINAWPPLNWRLPGWLLDIHAGNMMAYPVGGKNFGSSLTLLAAIVGSAALWRRRRRPLLGLMLLPALLTLMAALAGRYPYGTSARVAQHMAPAICLLAGAGAAALLGRLHGAHRIRSVFIFTGVMGLIVLVGMATDVARPTKEPSVRACRDALRDLAEKTDPRDRWVVFNALEPVDYAPQLKEAKGSGATFLYYIRHLAPVSVAWAPPPERVNMPAGGRVWVIVYHDNKAPTPEHQVDAYVARLSNRLGPPRRHHLWQLGQAAPPRYPYQEKIVAWEFDASPGR